MSNLEPSYRAEIAYSSDLWAVIIRWGQGHAPLTEQLQRLKSWPIEEHIWQRYGNDTGHFAQTSEGSSDEALARRATLLQTLCQKLNDGTKALPVPGVWTDWIVPLWSLWLPLALQIEDAQRRLGAPYVQGILGAQGTGKSTLADILQLLLGCLGQRAVSLSIDDLYLRYSERQVLAQQDSRLVWRGPPGTHDVALGLQTLAALTSESGESVAVPRFDKSKWGGQGDRTRPLMVCAPTVILFEGWFVGVQPLPDAVIDSDGFDFPYPIVSAADRQFAKDCNRRLREYLPLWAYLDSLIVLSPEDYRLSVQWRQAAEHNMQATGKPGLSPDEITQFVHVFWKALHPELFITPLTLNQARPSRKLGKEKTRLVVDICPDHRIKSLYLPGGGHTKSV